MNRTLYTFAIFFCALGCAINFLHGIFYFQLGRPIYTMESYSSWHLLVTTVTLFGSVLILKYYHHKQYRLALIAGVIATTASLAFSVLVYSMMMGAEVLNYYIPVYMFSLGGSILHGVSLLPPPAGKRTWLNISGILLFVSGTLLLAVTIAFTRNALTIREVERIHQWTSLVSAIFPGLFLLNFLNERNAIRDESPDPVKGRLLQPIMAAVAAFTFISFMIIGTKFTFQSLGAIAWRAQSSERSKRLAEPFEPRTFTDGHGKTLRYRFMKPVDYDSTKQYPIVICLHHGGTHGDDNMSQVDGAPIAQVLSTEENRRKYPAFLFVPQCPEGIGWGGIAALPAIDTLVFEGLAAFEKEFSIDKKRRYVSGISGGGYGSWHFICSRPEMFAAAIPVCGGTDPKLASRIVNVPVWAFHGEDDTSVPVRFSRDMVAAIKEAGGNPKYTEFANAGHNIWGQVNATSGLLEWMFEQKRPD